MTAKADAVSPTLQILDSYEGTTANGHKRSDNSIDKIPLLDPQNEGTTGAYSADAEAVRERKGCETTV